MKIFDLFRRMFFRCVWSQDPLDLYKSEDKRILTLCRSISGEVKYTGEVRYCLFCGKKVKIEEDIK